MIADAKQAVDEIYAMLKTAWEGSMLTTAYDIVWGNVAADFQGQPDINGNQDPWLQVHALHESSSKQSLRGVAGSRFENEGTLVCTLYTAEGKGTTQALPLIQVVTDAYMGTKSPGGVWFRNPQITDTGKLGTWYRTTATVTFLYDLVR